MLLHVSVIHSFFPQMEGLMSLKMVGWVTSFDKHIVQWTCVTVALLQVS